MLQMLKLLTAWLYPLVKMRLNTSERIDFCWQALTAEHNCQECLSIMELTVEELA